MNYDDNELLEFLKNNFKSCDHSDANGFTFSIETSGSSGGNCWDGKSTYFRVDNDEIIASIQEEIVSGVSSYFQILNTNLSFSQLQIKSYSLAEQIVDSPYDTSYHNEYYGNYSEYNKYFVSITEILDFLEDSITQEEKEKIIAISQEAQKDILSENMKEQRYSLLKETEKNIANFQHKASNEEKKLNMDLARAKKDVERITHKLSTLENTQSKDLIILEKTKNELVFFLGEDYIKSKETVKRKYGH